MPSCYNAKVQQPWLFAVCRKLLLIDKWHRKTFFSYALDAFGLKRLDGAPHRIKNSCQKQDRHNLKGFSI
jgi:hypothetical protein